MKRGRLDDLLTAVDAFKNAAGATITDVTDFLRSLGRRIAPKTITKSLKQAARHGLVHFRKRRYYPASLQGDYQIIRSKRRGKRGKAACPCFSKNRYQTVALRKRRRRARRRTYSITAKRSRRRRRRTRHRTLAMHDDLPVEARLVEELRRRRRSSRKRRRSSMRGMGVDTSRKAKGTSKKSYLVRPIKIEKDLDTSNDVVKTENESENQNEERKQEQNDKKQNSSGSDKDNNENQDQTPDEKESRGRVDGGGSSNDHHDSFAMEHEDYDMYN